MKIGFQMVGFAASKLQRAWRFSLGRADRERPIEIPLNDTAIPDLVSRKGERVRDYCLGIPSV